VKYREFSNPIDFFFSGIPMNYDSAGTKYNFESSGMCEILAFKDEEPVFVNPSSKPTINLKSENNSPEHSLYYLDTVQRKWTYQGTSAPTEIKYSKNNKVRPQLAKQEYEKPIKPVRANDKTPVIQIDVDPASFKELMAYNNMLFQLDPSEKSFNENDSLNEWNNVKLNRTDQYGVYRVSFSNDNTTVSYLARPVFEGENYNKALKVFEQKRIEYEKELSRAIANDKKNKDQYVLDSLEDKKENLRIEKLNTGNREKYIKDSLAYEKVLEENERITKLNVLIEARNMERARQRAIAEKWNNEMNQALTIYRSFEIDGFGLWNWDKPIRENAFPYAANFTDSNGKDLNVSFVAVVYSRFNSIMRFEDNNIQLIKDSRNMILGTHDGKLAFTIYDYYDDSDRDKKSKEGKFEMSLIAASEENYKRLKRLLEKP